MYPIAQLALERARETSAPTLMAPTQAKSSMPELVINAPHQPHHKTDEEKTDELSNANTSLLTATQTQQWVSRAILK